MEGLTTWAFIDDLARSYSITVRPAELGNFEDQYNLSMEFLNKVKNSSDLTVTIEDPVWHVPIEGRFNLLSLNEKIEIMSTQCEQSTR